MHWCDCLLLDCNHFWWKLILIKKEHRQANITFLLLNHYIILTRTYRSWWKTLQWRFQILAWNLRTKASCMDLQEQCDAWRHGNGSLKRCKLHDCCTWWDVSCLKLAHRSLEGRDKPAAEQTIYVLLTAGDGREKRILQSAYGLPLVAAFLDSCIGLSERLGWLLCIYYIQICAQGVCGFKKGLLDHTWAPSSK